MSRSFGSQRFWNGADPIIGPAGLFVVQPHGENARQPHHQRVAVVSAQRKAKAAAALGKDRGQRQKTAKAAIVSVPSARLWPFSKSASPGMAGETLDARWNLGMSRPDRDIDKSRRASIFHSAIFDRLTRKIAKVELSETAKIIKALARKFGRDQPPFGRDRREGQEAAPRSDE